MPSPEENGSGINGEEAEQPNKVPKRVVACNRVVQSQEGDAVEGIDTSYATYESTRTIGKAGEPNKEPAKDPRQLAHAPTAKAVQHRHEATGDIPK